MRGRILTAVLLLATSAAVAVAAPGPAGASYPGTNGRLAFAMADASGRHLYAVRPNGRGVQQLTHGAHTDLCAAYSPNGRRLAFCSDRSGSFEIWTMSAAGRGLRRITDVAFAIFPDFSPRGDRIAFSGNLDGGAEDDIFVINSDGTHLVRLTSAAGNNDYPAWSPDGRSLAFISDRTGVSQVFTMAADGTSVTQLTTAPVGHGELPDWRPDGGAIAYAQGDEGSGRIWVMNADGSDQHQVSRGVGDDFGPAFSPDGRKIAFVRQRPDGDRPVLVIDATGGHAHVVLDPGGDTLQYVPSWQPVG